MQHFEREDLLEMIECTHVTSKHSIKNAWTHVEKAKLLLDVDNQMAIFRAITAEEEAATGIIAAIKHLGYENSKLLNSRDHKHKTGIWSLLLMISKFFIEVDAKENLFVNDLKLVLNNKTIKLELSIPHPMLTVRD